MRITSVKRNKNSVAIHANNGWVYGSSRRKVFNESFLFDNTVKSNYIKQSPLPDQAIECQNDYDIKSAKLLEQMLNAAKVESICDQEKKFIEFINQIYQACNYSGRIE